LYVFWGIFFIKKNWLAMSRKRVVSNANRDWKGMIMSPSIVMLLNCMTSLSCDSNILRCIEFSPNLISSWPLTNREIGAVPVDCSGSRRNAKAV
jgi:hypothetical protein